MGRHAIVERFEDRRRQHYDQEIEKREARERNRVSTRNPIASNVNRECTREMVLAMRHPVEKIVRDHERLERFEDAIAVAKRARLELEGYGFEITDVETSMPPVRGVAGAVVLTGIIDFMLREDGKRYPVEVKSPHPLLFERLETLEDLDRYWWMKKWIDQLLAYLWAHELEEGFILLVAMGAKKWIHVDLSNEDLMARAVSAVEVAEEAQVAYALSLKTGELPAFASDPDTCRSCWAFGTVCQPPVVEQAVGRVDEEEFYFKATRALEIKPYHSEYESLWEYVKRTIKAIGREKVVCRDLAFTVTERKVKAEAAPRPARVDKVVKMFRAGERGGAA